MKKHTVVSFLIVALMAIVGIVFYIDLPFYGERLLLMVISIVIMGVIGEKLVFIYSIIVILGYGGFLTVYSFVNTSAMDYQKPYMYSHLITTAFILLYWVLLSYLNAITKENKALRDKVNLLEKYDTGSELLTMNEFISQARIISGAVFRRKEDLVLLRIHLQSKNKETQKNLREKLGEIILESIRKEFDIVTYDSKTIYVLLQNTQGTGVEIVKRRIEHKSNAVFMKGNHPFNFSHTSIDSIEMLISKVEG